MNALPSRAERRPEGRVEELRLGFMVSSFRGWLAAGVGLERVRWAERNT
jgi:hypothetical protein